MQAFMGTSAVSRRLKVSRTTVLNMTRDGRLTAAGKVEGPLGGYVYTPAEVERAAAVLEGGAR